MIPYHQEVLRGGLNRTIDRFFKKFAKPSLDGKVKVDATGVLVVLAALVGDLIRHAPEEMRDNLFLAFADSAVTIAGIKAEEKEGETETDATAATAPTSETLQ